MKRPATPIDLLGIFLGDAAPVGPALTAQPPVAPPATGWAVLSPTLYRLAGLLQAQADDRGVLWLAEADAGVLFGTANHGTQRNQLSALRRAGILDCAYSAGWFVRFIVQNPIKTVQNPTIIVQNPTTGGNGHRAESHENRAESHDAQNGIVQNPTKTVQNPTKTVQNPTIPTLTNKDVCLFVVDSETTNKQTDAPAPEPPFVPDPIEAAIARQLLEAVGVLPRTAEVIVEYRSLFDVRRVVGYWLEHRQSAGGTLFNTPNFVVKSLGNLEKARVPAAISPNFLYSELHRSHLTPAELAEYEPDVELEDDLIPNFGQKTPPVKFDLVRVRDEDAQVEPPADAPTGFDPVRAWAEFAAAHDGFRGTKLLAYDPTTGAATISAPAGELGYLNQRGAIIARKHTPARFGRPVFATFEEVEP